ncbi:hypothetical protein BDZ89DRAFT_568370 [Hymenopellis radicata]|nr:hypothetical protein BDZ89DRAFT_568370 [Hymenopellis radicata]
MQSQQSFYSEPTPTYSSPYSRHSPSNYSILNQHRPTFPLTLRRSPATLNPFTLSLILRKTQHRRSATSHAKLIPSRLTMCILNRLSMQTPNRLVMRTPNRLRRQTLNRLVACTPSCLVVMCTPSRLSLCTPSHHLRPPPPSLNPLNGPMKSSMADAPLKKRQHGLKQRVPPSKQPRKPWLLLNRRRLKHSWQLKL